MNAIQLQHALPSAFAPGKNSFAYSSPQTAAHLPSRAHDRVQSYACQEPPMLLGDLIRHFNTRSEAIQTFPEAPEEAFHASQYGLANAIYGELTLHSVFQPLFSLQHGTICGHEAFLRARSDLGGLSPEAVFVLPSTARESLYLDRLVRTLHTINFQIQHLRGNTQTAPLHLNLHPRHLRGTDEPGLVFSEILQRCGLSPQQITIELVEDGNNEPHYLRHLIERFRERGFRLALDGIGKGFTDCHSDFARLWDLSPDMIKISPLLLTTTSQDQRSRRQLQQCLTRAREEGITTVLTGIEKAEQLTQAWESGADLVQGNFLSSPAQHCLPRDFRLHAEAQL